MKYSRPVWELMGDCAQTLPDRFRFSHVQRWFDAHYPDINERTLRVHLIGLTEGPTNRNPYLAKKPAMFRRVEHGEYEVIGRHDDGRVSGPDSIELVTQLPDMDRTGTEHVLLVGHEQEQRDTPAPARDLFIGPEFSAVREAADAASGLAWFVLSSEYGLVRPDVVLSPYGRRLRAEPRGFRRSWAQWTVAKLAVEIGELDSATIDISADDQFLEPLVEVVEAVGARVRLLSPQRGGARAGGRVRAPR